MNIVGFDFGTSNSLVSAIVGGKPVNYLDEDGGSIPSVVCYEGGSTIVGRHARKRVAEAGLGIAGTVVRSPKSHLGEDLVHVGGVSRSVVDVVSDVIREVKRVAAESSTRRLSSIDLVVATIPVHFDGRKRARLRDAFGRAGIRVHQWMHEPFAALYGHFAAMRDPKDEMRRLNRSLVLVFDWGGGTLDLTLCSIRDGSFHQIRNDGTDLCGGDYFDQAILETIAQASREKLGAQADVPVYADARARLLDKCERAKVDLSTRDHAMVYVDRYFREAKDDSIEYQLTRSVLEHATASLVDMGISRIEALLKSAGVSVSQISMCLATGGMVNMPAIRSRLHELFGPERVAISSSGGSAIAEGAAWVAAHAARLAIAKPIELAIARGSFLPLFPAGTPMPVGGMSCEQDFGLYCVDPRDGHAKFQVVTPDYPSADVSAGDPRRVLATCTLPVHRDAQPNLERLEFRARIDQDLVLHGNARSLMQKAAAALSVFDMEFSIATPWVDTPGKARVQATSDFLGEPVLHQPGDVVLRSNVADRPGDDLVPGELLYRTQPSYFDTRNEVPKQQRLERLYYEPCARCGRAINDPDCRCGTRP